MESDPTGAGQNPRRSAAGDGVCGLDPQGRCTFINPAGAALLRFRAEEVLGRDLHALIHHTRADGTPYPRSECPLAAPLLTGEAVRLDDELLWRGDGTSFHAELTVYPLRAGEALQGAVALFRDLTAEKEAHRRLLSQIALTHTIVNQAADAIFMMDGEGRTTFANAAAEQMFGWSRDELLGKKLHDVLHHRHPDGSPFPMGECPLGEVFASAATLKDHEDLFIHRNGRWVPVLCSNAPIIEDGKVTSAVLVVHDLSERKRLQADLQRAHEERLGLLAREREARQAAEQERDFVLRVTQSAPLAIGAMEGPEHRFTYVNPATAELCGLLVEDFLGRRHCEVAPEADTVVGPILDRVLRTGQPEVVPELQVRLPNGRTVSIHGIWTPLAGTGGQPVGVLYLALDTTELRRAQEALRAAHDTFRHLVENSPFGVYAVDADFRLVQVSAGAQKVFENVRPLLGRDFAEVLRTIWPEPFASEALGYFRHTLETGEPYHSPSTVERRRDISEVEAYDWKIERVTLPDGRYGVVCHFYDLSERQQYEEALREADRRKDEFLAMLAHELRNPLGTIRNAVGVLRQAEPGSDAFQRGLEVATRQIRHQSQIVEDLLDVSRIRRGKLELRHERVDLKELVRDTAEDFRCEVERRGLTLLVELPGSAVPVRGDRTRLAQVLGNLLSNASKFTPAGGQVRVELTTGPRVDDAGSSEPERRPGTEPLAFLRVTDNGIGIDPSMFSHLFEPFAQADRSLDRSRGGLGLGLALVRGLVEMHGGEVQGYSAGEGQGTEFTVSLPLDREPSAPPLHGPGALATAGPLRVLVVEDLPDAADTLRDLLEMSGYTVEVAHNGPSALRAATEFQPQVVLCDIGLPGMDGYAVAEELRRRTPTTTAYLIALTGYGQEEDRRRSEVAGFDLHLTKPVEPEALNRVLASLARR